MGDSVSPEDIRRIDDKLDRLTEAVERLTRVEERQALQNDRLAAVEQRQEKTADEVVRVDKKVDMWINRGVGVWGLAGIAFTLWQASPWKGH